jgi:hypothetical protein
VKSEEDEYFKEEEEPETVIETLDVPVLDTNEQHSKTDDDLMVVERLYDNPEEEDFVELQDDKSINSLDCNADQQQELLEVDGPTEEKLTQHTLVQCTICSTEMLFKNYKAHCLKRHRVTTKKYECKQCNTVLSSLGNYTKHLKSKMHRERPRKSSQSKNKRSPCTICGRVFTLYYLETHMQCHYATKPFKCDVGDCKASFYSKSSLATHKTNIHFPIPVAPEAM